MTSRLPGKGRELIAAIARQSSGVRTAVKLPGSRPSLIRAYYAAVPSNDLRYRDPKTMAALALRHLSGGRLRRRGTAIVRVFNPTLERDGWTSDATIVQLVNDDMPFLVDSVAMALNRLGHGVELLIHPRLGASRTKSGQLSNDNGDDAESYIHIEISQETNSQVLRRLRDELESTLNNVRAAVEDWQPMVAKLRDASAEVRNSAPARSVLRNESADLLSWLADDHFTLLGYQEFKLRRGKHKDRLRAVPGTGLGISRDAADGEATVVTLNPQASKVGRTTTPLVITKTDASSTIHRSGHLDLIGVKVFGPDGKPRAVRRFVGLFTSAAYHERPSDVPLVRLKIDKVMTRSGQNLPC